MNIVKIGRMHPWILGAGVAALAWAADAAAAPAPPVCEAPQRVRERFIDATCAGCWAAPDPAALPASTWVLDWITPAATGADAPLAVGALPEAAERFAQLGADHQPLDRSFDADWRLPTRTPLRLAVTAGPAWNGYLGLQLEARGRAPKGATAYLALVEDIPAGAEGNAAARRLVRAVVGPLALPAQGLRELRALRVPEGAKPERLRAMGWWLDNAKKVSGIAVEGCPG
jgi:hypothetical protein